ncbi:MAG: hypothetical protein HYZ81_11635 [Nitrospinae bacterium]|nr:hypothetical protein [Nitrospinota bacterium]
MCPGAQLLSWPWQVIPGLLGLLGLIAGLVGCGGGDGGGGANLIAAGSIQLSVVSGDGQRGVVGQPANEPLVVAVGDGPNRPLPGISVTFVVLTGAATVSPATALTDINGQATTHVTFGTTPGPVRVQAQLEGEGIAPVGFTITGIPDRDTAHLLTVSGDDQLGQPGQVLPEPFVVRLLDRFANPVPGEPVRAVIVDGNGEILPATAGAALSLASISLQALPPIGSTATAFTDARGEVVFRLRTSDAQETIVVEVEAPDLPQASPVQFVTSVGLVLPVNVAIEADGRLVVVDALLRALVRVDPVSGAAILLSWDDRGGGSPFRGPRAVAVEADGQLVVLDNLLKVIVRVDPRTGDRTLLSGQGIGAGPLFQNPFGIGVEPDGHLVVLDRVPPAVVRVDPRTGDRTLVSGGASGLVRPFLFRSMARSRSRPMAAWWSRGMAYFRED